MKVALLGVLLLAAVSGSPVARSEAPDLAGTYALARWPAPAIRRGRSPAIW